MTRIREGHDRASGDRPWLIPFSAFLAYQAIAIAMTWPLLPGLARDVPGDLGDSLLNLWILAWGAENVPRLLTGQISLQDYWNANIFHPEPLALSFSEHLFGEVLQILPVYHLTGNAILSYNLLFLTSFSLSAWAMFLLVRDIVEEEAGAGRWAVAAAFVAGLIYAFIPFRVAHTAHIQALSSQWMPLALYGFRRFIVTRSTRALAGGSAALLMQNWSCGYYLIFFAPFVPLFVIHQLWTAGRLREWRMWAWFAGAAALVAAGTWPFLTLYLDAQRVYGFERPLGEVIEFSADVYSYFTAPGAVRLWGQWMLALPKGEGELFFGIVPMVLAAIGLGAALARRSATSSSGGDGAWVARRIPPRLQRLAVRFLVIVIALQALAFAVIVLTGGFVTAVGGVPLRATNATRIFINLSIAAAALCALSADARRRIVALLRSHTVAASVFMAFALWMSLGPIPHTRGQLLQVPAIYAFFYDYVPGFDGLRVPARYAMVAAVFLSIVAGVGAAVLMDPRRRPDSGRRPALIAAALGLVYLVETAFAPMTINLSWGGNDVRPPDRVYPAADAPAVYQHLATMPDATAIAEFPFGDISWELRYVYYSTVHWKRLLNGYSGGFPPNYKTRVALFEHVAQHPDEAWRALRAAGTTHVIVHEGAFAASEAAAVKQWLTDHFAVEIARFEGGDVLYDVDGVFGVGR